MPTFIIKDIPNWKDAPQRVNTFGLELRDANGERRFVDFTRGWLQRFRPMTMGYITFRGAEPWQSSMAAYSPTGPDELSVWPDSEKVEAPTPVAEAQDSPNHAEIIEHYAAVAKIDPAELAKTFTAEPTPRVTHIDAGKAVFEQEVTEAIKAAHRPLSKVPSVLANTISKEIDVLAKGGDLGKKPEPLLPAPLTDEERALVRDLRREVTAIRANLDAVAKERDAARMDAAKAHGTNAKLIIKQDGDAANVNATLLRQAKEREASATERASRVDQLHSALVEKYAALSADYEELRNQRKALRIELDEQRDKTEAATMRVDELEAEMDDLRANGPAYAAMAANEPSINDMARESAIERLTMSTALGLTREQLETLDAGTLDMLATWESDAELRKLTEYGQTFRYFGGAQRTEQALHVAGQRFCDPMGCKHCDAEKTPEPAQASTVSPDLNPVHDLDFHDGTGFDPQSPESLTKPKFDPIREELARAQVTLYELLPPALEADFQRHEQAIAKQAKALKKLRKQLRAAGVIA